MKAANFLLCLVGIAVSAGNDSTTQEDSERIVNGIAIPNRQAPYIVRITNNGTYCGGTLVAPDYVVTAAHCVHGRSMDGITIIANITSINENGIRRKVIRMSEHPEYNDEDWHSDVAVLQLDEPLRFTPSLKLCEKRLEEGNEIQVSGWGRLAADKPASTNLQTVTLSVVSNETCSNEYGSSVEKNMFCASGKGERATCRGDSGGPAVFNKTLCGIVAFSFNCTLSGLSEAYTDVYEVKPFIKEFMENLDYIGMNIF